MKLVAVLMVLVFASVHGGKTPLRRKAKAGGLSILDEPCTTTDDGLVRYRPGNNYLEVCSNEQWSMWNPVKRLRTGLVGHWKMDEISGNNVDDDSGHENHGTAYRAAVGRGKFTRGRVLNANNGRITIPDTTGSLDFGTGSFSIAGWQIINDVNYPKTTFSVRKGFGCYFGPGRPHWIPSFEIAHGYQPTGTQVCIRDHLNNQVLETMVHDAAYAPPNLLRKWAHYVFIFDRSPGVQRVTLFLNGQKQRHTIDISRVTGSIDNNNSLEFGLQYGWQTQGTLDEYRVYNYALSANEAKLLYSDHTV